VQVLARRLLLTLAFAAVAASLAGCGGASKPTSQTVVGQGFSFRAPPAWRLSREAGSVVASSGQIDLVEVLRYRLERAYRPALFAATSRELDNVVERLAGQIHGRLAGRSTVQVAGATATDYRVLYGSARTLEIAFLLKGNSEYELLCRRRAADPDVVCAQLFSSFALG
jgi:hypothetical protein